MKIKPNNLTLIQALTLMMVIQKITKFNCYFKGFGNDVVMEVKSNLIKSREVKS